MKFRQRLFWVLAGLVAVLVFGLTVLVAQDDETDAECDYTSIEGIILDLVADLGEQDAPDDALMTMQTLVSAFRADCAGMHWRSDELGLQPVIGPVDFGESFNTYKVTLTTTGYAIVKIEGLEGGCPASYDSLFSLFPGQGDMGAQMVQRTNGCVGMITVENTTEPWELMFERVE